jgi:hypothetical protein
MTMSFLRLSCLLAVPALLLASHPQGGTGTLSYRVKLRMQGDSAPIETRCTLIPTPVVATANRTKKARMGAWRLEAQQPKDASFSQAMVLARVERMLYFAGPAPELEARDLVVHFGEKPCRVWAATIPAGLNAYAYLVEVSPGLLALSYFSGSFAGGDVASLEIQLDSFHLDAGAAPAEDGMALIHTLRKMAMVPKEPALDGGTQFVP